MMRVPQAIKTAVLREHGRRLDQVERCYRERARLERAAEGRKRDQVNLMWREHDAGRS